MNNAKVISVAAGGLHSLAIDEHGILWAWGYNGFGQLGDGTTIDRSPPVQVNTAGRMNNAKIVSVAAGAYHSLAIDEHGNLWAFGRNNYGQLGDGTAADRSSPIQVNTGGRMNNVKAMSVAAGGGHSFAIDEHGTLWAWGHNSFGQLGDGTAADRSSPIQVNTSGRMNNAKVTFVAAGYEHSIAIDELGNLWVFGRNNCGQLGDGTVADSSSPIQVNTVGRMNNAKVTAVAAGRYHSLAVDGHGALWAWGDNGFGQLGDGTTTDRSYPLPIFVEP